MSYIVWSVVNWAAVVMAVIAIIVSLISAFFDLLGKKDRAKFFFGRSVSPYFWFPSFVVLLTRWMGINNGHFPF